MSEIERLVRDLETFRTRPAAKAALLKLGTTAVPALVEALRHPNEAVRWVAARTLGEIGSPDAEGPLRDAARQPDMEMVCAEALEAIAKKTGATLGSGASLVAGQTHDPLSVIRTALSGPQFSVTDAREGVEVKVDLDTGRSQRIAVTLHMKDAEGREYVQFRTECGPARPEAYEWSLKQNAKNPLASIGIAGSNPPIFVMVRNVYRDAFHANEVLRTVMALAAAGDAFEKALTKEDKR